VKYLGKSLLQQRDGRGNINFRSPGWRRLGKVKYPAGIQGLLKGKVVDILHNPGTVAPLALIELDNGLKFFNVAVQGLRQGQAVEVGKGASPSLGNVVRIGDLPEGTSVCNVESKRNDGGKIARAAGTYAVILGKSEDKVVLKLSSGKVKEVSAEGLATVGIVAGGGVTEKPLLKAGASYHKYKVKATKWPRVSGVHMNVVDHPHGGGHHKSVGRSSTVARNAPPGKKVGHIAARRTGRRER
jgi:large subunit ribosomal protein L2